MFTSSRRRAAAVAVVLATGGLIAATAMTPAQAAILPSLKIHSSMTETITPQTVQQGSPATLTVTASIGPNALVLHPTGTVTFKEWSPSTSYLAPPDVVETADVTCAALIGPCTATITASTDDVTIEPGIWTINAYYSGNAVYTGNAVTGTFEVLPAP